MPRKQQLFYSTQNVSSTSEWTCALLEVCVHSAFLEIDLYLSITLCRKYCFIEEFCCFIEEFCCIWKIALHKTFMLFASYGVIFMWFKMLIYIFFRTLSYGIQVWQLWVQDCQEHIQCSWLPWSPSKQFRLQPCLDWSSSQTIYTTQSFRISENQPFSKVSFVNCFYLFWMTGKHRFNSFYIKL